MILHTSRTFFSFFPPSEARPSETPPALPTSGASRISIMLTAGGGTLGDNDRWTHLMIILFTCPEACSSQRRLLSYRPSQFYQALSAHIMNPFQ